jgi:hypothetical protein
MLAPTHAQQGIAFTLEQREALGLTGPMPTGVTTNEGQLHRVHAQYQEQVRPGSSSPRSAAAEDSRKWVM